MDWGWTPKYDYPIVLKEIQGKFIKGEFNKWLRKLNKKPKKNN
tara:strand:+ start:2667 stop:2795 length:129 start_codon:yes stop_codon:yes gene_type:complete